MNSSDPWRQFGQQQTHGSLRIIRIDVQHRWDLYWAVRDAHRVLLVRLSSAAVIPEQLPSFEGVRLRRDVDGSDRPLLLLELLDDDVPEVFLALCNDIIEVTRVSGNEEHLIRDMIARTWLWHRFLKAGQNGAMPSDAQRGLIGELETLQSVIVPLVGASAGLQGWTGPFGTTRDFQYGMAGLETKTWNPVARPMVTISSEFQLDSTGLQDLLLVAVPVAPGAAQDGRTLTQIVSAVRASFEPDGLAVAQFDGLLAAAGFDPADDYSGRTWSVGDPRVFRVTEGFPAIRAGELRSGVSNVRYDISLDKCAQFETNPDALATILGGTSHALGA